MGLFNWLFESEEDRVKRLILERQEEAMKKGIPAKIAMIAELFGVKKNLSADAPLIVEHLYSDPAMHVYYKKVIYDSDICYVWQIELMNTSGVEAVFSATETTDSVRPRISTYVPGAWETHFESLYKRSLSAQAEGVKKAAEATRKAEQDKRKRFGL